MICPQCGSPHTTIEVGQDCQLVHSCVECDARWNPALAPEANEVAPVPQAPRPVQRQAPPKAIPNKPGDIIRMARQRVRELNAEINKLSALKKERDELKRLLAAAKTKRDGRSNLRPLRTATQG